MLTSLQTAVSGMRANGTYISAIADNIANMNTFGFKKTTLTFGDILSASMVGVSGSAQIGRGALVQKAAPLFTQGPLETTENGLDLAIDGNGFFIVKKGDASYYTRSGRFDIDQEGYIINASGLRLQGFLADATGKITGQTGDLQLLATQTPSRATTEAMIFVNLDGYAVENNPVTDPFGIIGANNDQVVNYHYSAPIRVYDTQGGGHHITLYYNKIAPNTWNVHYVYEDPLNPGQLIQAEDSSALGSPAVTTLTFDTHGALVSVAGADPQFYFGNSIVVPQAIAFDHTRNMQHKSDFAVLDNNQDGYASGSLDRLVISNGGEMTGIFSNGQARFVGQVALAKFIAPTELLKIGWNLYTESSKSGQPIVSAPTTSGLGDVFSNTIELSNVDLADEFVKLITAQRGFQANSRIITTTDELLAEVVNLKR